MPRLLRLALLAAVFGCRPSAPSAIPIAAERSELSDLAGTWSGEYTSPTTGRSGTIRLTIHPGTDTAFGDVVMIPRRSMRGPDQPAGEPGTVTYPNPQSLEIRFVRVSGSRVSGLMAPYTDPDCSCVVTTTFTGEHAGNRISGTFRTVGRGADATGTWWVTRHDP